MVERCRCNNCPECRPPGRILLDEEDDYLDIEIDLRESYEDAMDTLESQARCQGGLKHLWDEETERLGK